MKNFIAIVRSTDGVLDKFQDFDTQAEADTHIAQYGGWVAPNPGGNNKNFWVINEQAKTLAYDQASQDAGAVARQWAEVRAKRNQLLAESDWRAMSDLTMSDAWKTYRQALRDVGGQADPSNITWPEEPS
jgi:hypothetical protein|tara:strand:+ start:2221 stop:2610 length:390 start_codon:yes stop_codon:yes gene_type:complete